MTNSEDDDEPPLPTSAVTRRTLLQSGLTGLALTSGVSGLPTGAAVDTSLDSTTTAAIPVTTAQTEAISQYNQQQKLSANDGNEGDLFGDSVALAADGTTALIGASENEDPNGRRAGSAYVFTRSDGEWSQQQKLAANDGNEDDLFGGSVALSADGTTALIGAFRDHNSNGEDAGSAYVFARSNGEWSQQQKLAAADGDNKDRFGDSVALSADGTTALIGATVDEDPNGRRAGSVYVFARSNGEWSQQQKLAASDGDRSDEFGSSVALSADGTTAVIGAFLDEDPNGNQAGSAYIFARSSGGWSQQQKLAANDGDSDDEFGESIALSDDGATALIGASDDEDPNGQRAGSVYVFARSNGEWSQQQKLTSDDGDSNDELGFSVALAADGTTALIGAFGEEDPNGEDAGSAYVFARSKGEWNQQQKLAAADGEINHLFGYSVALAADGTTALIGAYLNAEPNGTAAGSAYVFTNQEAGTINPTQLTLAATPASPVGVTSGGIEKISLQVENTSNSTLTDIEFGLDPSSYPDGWATVQSIENSVPIDENPQSDQFAGSWDPSTAMWTIDSLPAGQTASAAITVAAPDSVSVGTTSTLTARCGTDSPNDVTSSVAIDIVDRFDPTVHGFGFSNWADGENIWPAHDHDEISRQEVRQLIDAFLIDLEDAAEQTLSFPRAVLLPALVSIMYPVINSGAATDGHCYGMVYAVQEYFKQPDTLPVSTAETANDITAPPAGNDAVGSDIDFYQNSQFFDNDTAVLLLQLALQQVPAPQATVDALRQTIETEGVAPVALSESGGNGGHQVLAYAVTDTADTTELHIYDPSSPGVPAKQRPGFNHWAREFDSGPDLPDGAATTARGTSIEFNTSGQTTTVSPYNGYDQIAPLTGGGDVDLNGVSALASLKYSVRRLATQIGNFVSFEFSFDLDGSATNEAVASTTTQTQAAAVLDSVDVSVTDPNRESVLSVGPGSSVDISQYEFDIIQYVPNASTGEYSISIESDQSIEYTARARGIIAGGGEIDDTTQGLVADGDSQQVTATVPESSDESGAIGAPTVDPSLSTTVEQAGSPDRQARVQYTISGVSGQSSVALAFTTPSQLSINPSNSDTGGMFGSDTQQLLFTEPDDELTATIAFDIASDTSTDATFDIDTEVLNEDNTITDSVTTTVGDIKTGPVKRFDADDDGDISLTEVQDAIRAFSNGELDLQGVQQVIAAFAN